MSCVKVACTLDRDTLIRLYSAVSKSIFPNRSRAIQAAVSEKLAGMERARLASECAKVDPRFEKALAQKGLGKEIETWPGH